MMPPFIRHKTPTECALVEAGHINSSYTLIKYRSALGRLEGGRSSYYDARFEYLQKHVDERTEGRHSEDPGAVGGIIALAALAAVSAARRARACAAAAATVATPAAVAAGSRIDNMSRGTLVAAAKGGRLPGVNGRPTSDAIRAALKSRAHCAECTCLRCLHDCRVNAHMGSGGGSRPLSPVSSLA